VSLTAVSVFYDFCHCSSGPSLATFFLWPALRNPSSSLRLYLIADPSVFPSNSSQSSGESIRFFLDKTSAFRSFCISFGANGGIYRFFLFGPCSTRFTLILFSLTTSSWLSSWRRPSPVALFHDYNFFLPSPPAHISCRAGSPS